GKLAARARPSAKNALDVSALAEAAKLVHFGRNKLQDFMDQAAGLHFALAAEIDQLAIEPVARGAPAILIDHAPPIDSERCILPKQFVQFEYDGLHHRGQRDRVLDAALGIANPELQPVKEWM